MAVTRARPRPPARTRRKEPIRASQGLCRPALVVVMAWGSGCGQPNPKIIDASEPAERTPAQPEEALSEDEKIRMLIAAVRRSELTFVQDEIERTGTAAAEKLQLLLDRNVDGVRDARAFIDSIAAPTRDGAQDTVILGPEQSMLGREWFQRQLAKIEGGQYEPPAEVVAAERAQAERSGKRLRILDALMIVERSEATFVVPARRALPTGKPAGKIGENGKTDGKTDGKNLFKKRAPRAREYTGPEFADMLRKKWEFLGAGIDELEPFIKEIASDSFASLEPYRVRHADGTTDDFETWLRARLDDKARQLAQGG